MSGSLNNVRVLELARYQAGPRAGMVLSDLGAEVIKIEKKGGEETRKSGPFVGGQSVYFGAYNRGKKSICLDLRQKAGKDVFFDLLAVSDIVIENFRPGTLETMGLGYEEQRKIKPDIILVRVSGFGQTGPLKDRPGFDTLGQAMGGLMALTGKTEGRPIGTAFSLIDRITALHAAIGALAALRHRDKTGVGQVIDVCLMDSALTTVEIPLSYFLSTGEEGGESGRRPYEAKDGWIAIEAGTSRELTQKIADTVGIDLQAIQKEKAQSGGSLFGPRVPELMTWCKERTVSEIYEHFLGLGVPVAPVCTIPEVAKNPHVRERMMLPKVKDTKGRELHVPGLSIKFSETPGKIGPVPMPAEHEEEILRELLGYSLERIEELRAQKVL